MISTDVECHIWAPPFQLTAHVTALHAPAFRGHRVCNPSLISHVTVPTLGLEPGVERSTVTGALRRACVRVVDAARISD